MGISIEKTKKTENTIVCKVPISDNKKVKEFVELERKLIGKNPLFVSETDSGVRKYLKGQSAFFNDAKHALFVSSDGTQNKARCAAFVNHRFQQTKGESIGFIGYFAAAESSYFEVQAMFDQAEAWLREQSVSRVITPYNSSALLGFGLLTKAFEEEPIFPHSWHPPYYKDYFQKAGYHSTYPFWFYKIQFTSEKYRLVARNALNNKTAKIIPFNRKDWDTNLENFRKLVNEIFTEEWEFHPYTKEEFHEFFDPFKPVVDPKLWLMAQVEGKMAGFCFGMPDWSPMFRSFKGKMGPLQIIKFLFKAKKYNRAGILMIGVLPEYRGKGIAQALATRIYKRFEEQGLNEAFYYPVNESNIRSRRFAESMGGAGRVMYHCYDKNLL